MLTDVQLGEYLLLKRLAMGGQSEVFLALRNGEHGFNRPVVLKTLPKKQATNPKLVELFYQEAFICARFAHPHLISVHDVRAIDGEHVMVMDYVSGQTVADIAQRGAQQGQPLAMLHAVQIVADICAALDHAHTFRDADEQRYKIIHCDISPQNLMVTYDGLSKLCDFGIARIQGRGDGDDVAAGGKFSYMSPEQCLGHKVDPRSDIFSLGIILYELTTGYRLFRRDSTPEVMRALTEDPIEAPSRLNGEVPMYLDRCIMKALEREPNARYQTAMQFREDLLDFLTMHRSSKVRVELADYVSGLFAGEREETAALLRDSVERRAGGALEPASVTLDPVERDVPEGGSGEDGGLATSHAVQDSRFSPSPEKSSNDEFERERLHRRMMGMDALIRQMQERERFLFASLMLALVLVVLMGLYTYRMTG
jgi:eukaryotic-like serine/threonine-protein kinase